MQIYKIRWESSEDKKPSWNRAKVSIGAAGRVLPFCQGLKHPYQKSSEINANPSNSKKNAKNMKTNIRRAFAQGVSDHDKCDFATDTFNLFEHLFERFASEANPNSHFRAISRIQSQGHELEQQFELELLCLVWVMRTRGGVPGSHRTRR